MYLLSLMLENYLQPILDCYCISYREGPKVARDAQVKRKIDIHLKHKQLLQVNLS